MTIDNALTDKTVRIFDKMFEYIHNQNVSFLTYMNKDFPMSHVFEQGIRELETKNIDFHFRYIENLKNFNKNSKLIVFTILLNNVNINDVTYQYSGITSLYKVNFKKDIFQIFFNCHYTNYREMMEMYLIAIHRSIEKHF